MHIGFRCAALGALLLAAPPAGAADPLPAVGDCREGPPFARAVALCTDLLDHGTLAARERAAALRIRGTARLQVADNAGGMADLDRSIALDPEDPVAYRVRAGARAAAGDLPGALADATEAVRLRPEDPGLLLARAGILVRQQRLDQAHADASRAIALAPGSAAYRLRAEICLAGAAASHGTPPPCDLAAALADVEQAELAAGDTDTEIAALLVEGRIWEAMDRPAKAIAAYEAGIDADEGCEECLAAERRVQDRAARAGRPGPGAPAGGGQPAAPVSRAPLDPLVARINAESGRAVSASGGKLVVTTGLRLAADGRLEILAHPCPGLTPKSPKARIEACRAADPASGEGALRFAPADIDPATLRMETSAHTYRVQFQCQAARPCIAHPDSQPAVSTAALACPDLTACNGLALDLASLLAQLAPTP